MPFNLRLVLVLCLLSAPAHALVKKSSSGLCHDESSRYFATTQHFTAFNTLDDCLRSGGKLPKQATSVHTSQVAGYAREKFGHGWQDVDHDGYDTRQEVLMAQNTGTLVFNNKGRVIHGKWISFYSGQVFTDASKLDIDHVVPLSWAWKHGADKWSQEKREQFANDERNLVAVEASVNRSKGDKGLDEWLPPSNQQQYKARFMRILKLYGIS